MSRLVRELMCAAAGIAGVSASAGAQLLGVPVLPPIGVPLPAGNLPLAGPLLPDVLGQPVRARRSARPSIR